MPTPTIVFDLDGTLIDTAPDLIDTLNTILTRHDVAPVAFDEARTMIGAEELTIQPPRSGETGGVRLELSKVRALDDAGAVAVHEPGPFQRAQQP